MATGLLVVCVGNALKLVPYLQKGRKRYFAEVTFGQSTDTYDLDGTVESEAPVPNDLHEKLSSAIPRFAGTIMQKPPAYSAIKVDGKRLYRLARRGKDVELKEREVTFHSLTVRSRRKDAVVLDVVCSAGTYIRSLAHDLGAVVGCPSVLSSLRRIQSTPFSLDDAVRFEELATGRQQVQDHLLPIESALPPLPTITVSADQERMVLNGRQLEGLAPRDGYVLLLSGSGALLAIGEGLPCDGVVRIRRVIAT